MIRRHLIDQSKKLGHPNLKYFSLSKKRISLLLSLDNIEQYSISLWILFNKNKLYTPIISQKNRFCLSFLETGSLQFSDYHISGDIIDNRTAFVKDNKWHHIGITKNDRKSIFYIDGKKVKALARTCQLGTPREQETGPLEVGDLTEHRMDMHNICIYNKALSSEEINETYLAWDCDPPFEEYVNCVYDIAPNHIPKFGPGCIYSYSEPEYIGKMPIRKDSPGWTVDRFVRKSLIEEIYDGIKEFINSRGKI